MQWQYRRLRGLFRSAQRAFGQRVKEPLRGGEVHGVHRFEQRRRGDRHRTRKIQQHGAARARHPDAVERKRGRSRVVLLAGREFRGEILEPEPDGRPGLRALEQFGQWRAIRRFVGIPGGGVVAMAVQPAQASGAAEVAAPGGDGRSAGRE